MAGERRGHIPEQQLKELEFPFCYYAYGIDPGGDVDHFHYGLWEEGTDDIKTAQARMTDLVVSLIPSGAGRILDAGCGLGTTSFMLAQRGCTVVGISPDQHLMAQARLRYGGGENPRFITTSLERFDAEKPFDLILFQESAQYIPVRELFSMCQALLDAGGHLLISDEVVYRRRTGFPFLPVRSELLEASRAMGFRLVSNRVITPLVFPTFEFSRRVLDRKHEIIKAFAPYRPKVVEELDELDRGWKTYHHLYATGEIGYEIFLFRRRWNVGMLCRRLFGRVRAPITGKTSAPADPVGSHGR